ncbi:MAG: hypothetical protein V1809_05190, partial [Planctomycetota bacterium]
MFKFVRIAICAAVLGLSGLAFADVRVWGGGSGFVGNDFQTPANWSGDAVPGPLDTVRFDNTQTADCNLTAPVNVAGIEVNAGYSGQIVPGGNTLTVGAGGFTQADGTFAGGTAAEDINGSLSVTGGTFIATANTLSIAGGFTVSGGGIFTANGGAVLLDGAVKTVDIGATTLNHVTVVMGGQILTVTGTLDVDGVLTLTSVLAINGGTIGAGGDVTVTDVTMAGSGEILFNGGGAQALGASGGVGMVPNVRINKGGGALALQDEIHVGGNWTWQAGGVNAGASHVVFPTGHHAVDSGAMVFHDVTLAMGDGAVLTVTGVMTVGADLTVTSVGAINVGTVAVAGDVMVTDVTMAGSGEILFNGGGAQVLGALGGVGSVPNLRINKGGGALAVADEIRVGGNWTWQAGVVNAGASEVVFTGGSHAVDAGGMSFNDVTLEMGAGATLTTTGTLDVNGDFTITSCGAMSGGTLRVAGDLSSAAGAVTGTTGIVLDGGAGQVMTGAGAD